jgi:hypothetical protein
MPETRQKGRRGSLKTGPACFNVGGGEAPQKAAYGLKAIDASESEIQAAIVRYLAVDRRVAWVERFNTGAMEATDARGKRRFIRFAFKGCADLLGQLASGHFLAIECKTRTGRLTPEQRAFLDRVTSAGGLAVVARSVDDVKAAIDQFTRGQNA